MRFYVPRSAITNAGDFRVAHKAIDGTGDHVHFGALTVGQRTTDRVLLFDSIMENLVKIDFHAMDQWFEEDVPVYGHPKDPYKRIDILHSTRNVKIGIDGVTLAD